MVDSTVNESVAQPVHIDDVVAYLGNCSESFSKIGAVLGAAVKDMEGGSGVDTKLLVKAAREMAQDMGNVAGNWSDEVKDGGVRST